MIMAHGSSRAEGVPSGEKMKRSNERILTTFVGSLIRPPELRELISAKEAGEKQKYGEALRSLVGDAVRKQAEIGVDVVSDGEFGKSNWASYILDRVSGFELRPAPPGTPVYNRFGREREEFADFYSTHAVGEWSPTIIVCNGPIGYDNTQILRDIDNFKNALEDVEVEEAFMPVVAPASFVREAKNEFYRSE